MIGAAKLPGMRVAALRHGLPVWPVAIWLVLVVSALIARPPLSPFESHPLSFAWWMWLDGSLLPTGSEEAGRPPLLFWLIHLGWAVFGVSEIWARLVMPLTALAALLLIGPVARLIWPDRPQVAPLAAVVLVGSGGFTVFSSLTVWNTPLLLFVLVGLYGTALAWRGRPVTGWIVLGLGLGLGFLMNGPSAVLHLLPVPLLAPLWARSVQASQEGERRWVDWYLGLGLAILVGLALGLIWIVPSVATGGLAGLLDILFEPAVPGFAGFESRPVYLLTVPFVLYPWLWWRTLWRSARKHFHPGRDEGLRLCTVAAVTSVIVACVVSEREFQDLLPTLPSLSLIAGRLLAAPAGKPKDFHAIVPGLLLLLVGLVLFLLNIVPVAHLDAVWREFIGDGSLPIWLGGISLVSGLVLLGGGYLLAQMTPRELFSRTVQLALLPVLLVTTLNIEFLFSLRRFFDLTPVAQQIQSLQQQGVPVAVFGRYHGEFDFSGRLEQPLTEFRDPEAVLDWARTNERGVVVSYFKGSVLRLPGQPLILGIVGNGWTALWSADTVRATDGAALSPRF